VSHPIHTLLLKFFKEIQAGDAWASEDDVVLPRGVLTEAFGHHTVELRFVLQSIQPISTTPFFEMDINLKEETGRKVSRL